MIYIDAGAGSGVNRANAGVEFVAISDWGDRTPQTRVDVYFSDLNSQAAPAALHHHV